MTSIRDALSEFLAEAGEGKRRSMSPPSRVIDLFGTYLDNYGYEGLNAFERMRLDKESDDDTQFSDFFDPGHIQPFHINSFLNTFVIRKFMGTKGFLKACGPVMKKLASWLFEKGHWDEDAMRYYREIAGDNATVDLVGCDELTRALVGYVDSHPVDDEVGDLGDDDYHDDQLTIKKVESRKIFFDAILESEEDIVISLPKSVTCKAKEGWSVTMEVARIEGNWRILGLGNVYP